MEVEISEIMLKLISVPNIKFLEYFISKKHIVCTLIHVYFWMSLCIYGIEGKQNI